MPLLKTYHIKIIAMNKLFFLLLSVLTFPAFSQQDAFVKDPNAVQRTINSDFNGIYVSDGVELYLTGGEQASLAVSASDEKYMERFITTVENGVLKIYYDNKGINWTGNEKRKLKAYVSYRQLSKLAASGGASVKLTSVLTAEKLEATFTSGAQFMGEVSINQLGVSQNSGASVEMNGKAAKLSVEASSGAIFKGYELATDYCNAKASSGGSVRLTVNKELNVKANSGGGIRYKGDGVIRDMNVNSGGMVKKG